MKLYTKVIRRKDEDGVDLKKKTDRFWFLFVFALLFSLV